MPKITKILEKQGEHKDRVYIYIDGKFCTSIRQRTWIGMRLEIDSIISCDELKTLENNFWKKIYGKESWEREKIRINRVIEWFNKYIKDVDIVPVGLGADHNDYLENTHSKEKGAPDLSVRVKGSGIEIILLEVSGTENMRGKEYWVRKDKVDYVKNHPDLDIWIVLHYKLPIERFIWLKIEPSKNYVTKIQNIKGADEFYVLFNDDDSEIFSSLNFHNYIMNKINVCK